ncbi:MAG: roadblock/LC7 domain-containing protein [Verrucomicrobiota bacterium]|jgi:predicted regulator of Ras-like GTPase activity (Roadblock/LC7/MglB family)
MATLPQLSEDDIQKLDGTLGEYVESADAMAALIIDKGGFLITHQGEAGEFDLTTIAALASGAFMANQTIAGLVNEKKFDSIYQQGESSSLFAVNVDEHCLLIVIFKSEVGVGTVKYHAIKAVKRIARQLKLAREREPDAGLDLSMLNIADTATFFRKKEKEEKRKR